MKSSRLGNNVRVRANVVDHWSQPLRISVLVGRKIRVIGTDCCNMTMASVWLPGEHCYALIRQRLSLAGRNLMVLAAVQEILAGGADSRFVESAIPRSGTFLFVMASDPSL